MSTTLAKPPEITTEPRNSTYRALAVIVGLLYVLGDASGISSALLTNGLRDDATHLSALAERSGDVRLAALCVLVMGLSLAPIPVLLYPILRRGHHALALAYVVLRGALETAMTLTITIGWWVMLGAAAADPSAGPGTGSALVVRAVRIAQEGAHNIGAIIFSLGAVVFSWLLYRMRLVPRWLAGWGLVAAPFYLTVGVAGLLGADVGLLVIPLAIQEMVLAFWLIFKGFDPDAICQGGQYSADHGYRPISGGGAGLPRPAEAG